MSPGGPGATESSVSGGTIGVVMITLLVGVLLVAASSVGFGLALFGHRPVPQPAMSLPGAHLGAPRPEAAPSISGATDQIDVPAHGAGGVLQVGRWRRALQREPSVDHQPAADVTLSPWVRARSAMYLTLIVTGIAAIIGIVTSIVVVGAVLLIT